MVSLPGVLLSAALFGGGGETVLLDFYSNNCQPCRMMDPVVQRFAAAGYPVRRVNVSDEPALANRFGVSNIPCFVMLVGGREVDRVVGLTSGDRLQQMFGRARGDAEGDGIQLVSGAGARGPAVVIPAVASKSGFSAAVGGEEASPRGPAPPGWRMSAPGGGDAVAVPARPAVSADELFAATVRLRIADGSGQSIGTGTIIDARQGLALIVTCGHVFRSSQGKGKIEVDLFGANAGQQLAGELIHYDLGSDLALFCIRTSRPVKVARVAPPGYALMKGAAVLSVGCDHGNDPTVVEGRITAYDKYGYPANAAGKPSHCVTASGRPVQGRSGGGLFTADGMLIGVCNAADPTNNEGLYAALASIQDELDYANLAYVYRDVPAVEPANRVILAGGPPAAPGALVPVPPPMPKSMPAPSPYLQPTEETRSAPATAAPAGSLREDERAVLEEIDRRRAEGAEVICVIRPRNNPQAKSAIIVIDRASPALLERLAPRGP